MSIELIRGELERLYSLEDMLELSTRLLGFPPESVGGTASTASFARALTDHCRHNDAIAALIDAVTGTKPDASPELHRLVREMLRAPIDLNAGDQFGPFSILRKLGAGPNGTVYAASRSAEADNGAQSSPKGETRPGKRVQLKLLHTSAIHDRSAVYRFLTRARLLAAIEHDNLPAGIEAGFVDDKPYVCHELVEGKSLQTRVARTGALHLNEVRGLLHAVLLALAAIHDAGLVHGAVKLENVLVGKNQDGSARPVLVDAGGDLLSSTWVHSDVATEGGNRIKGLAPEQLKGLGTTPQSDLYAFGALMFEVLTGKPPLQEPTATDLAVAHLSRVPPSAADVAPKGWVSSDVAELCSRLLEKNPDNRPALAEVLELIAPRDEGKSKEAITDQELNESIDSLVADPTDPEAAIALETTLERRADPRTVANAFLMAADEVDLEAVASAGGDDDNEVIREAKREAARDRARETKKRLLFNAARLFSTTLKDFEKAEGIYHRLVEMNPDDDVARAGYESALEGQEKLDDLVEYLLDHSQSSQSHAERARALHKIAKLYAGPLDDMNQAVYAFAQAVAQDVQNEQYVDDLEKAAGDNMTRWAEAMRCLHEVSEHPRMPPEARAALFMRLGTWYTDKIARPDLALPCFETVLSMDPAHEGALEGMTRVYRRAQQWQELVHVLKTRVDRAATPSRARDLRAEAAEILETRLNDLAAARELYEGTLREDPGHEKTVEALARIYRRDDDYAGYVSILARQADAQTGRARAETLAKMAEIHEDQLNDLAEAERKYLAALELDPTSLTPLRGLDRIYIRSGRYEELLASLEKQVGLSATPRQKITLYERMAGIYDEEFLDHVKAAGALEHILAIDGSHEGALTQLMRHYRALDRWDEVNDLYDKTLKVVTQPVRRTELLMAQGQVLLDQIGSPERARHAFEAVLQIDPNHAGALESLAHVRAATGDAMAALTAVESLAEKAESPGAAAEQWLRAANILEEHGDRDGAIERYKRALDAQPANATAATALRQAYLARGDAASAVALIQREIDATEGKLARARLLTDLAKICLERLNDPDQAREAAVRAVDLDPTNVAALHILGDLAFASSSFAEAGTHYGALVKRIDALDRSDAKTVLMRYIDAMTRSGSAAEAVSAAPALLRVAPDDAEAVRRAARVQLDSGDAALAARTYEDLFERLAGALSIDDRVEALVHYGRALRLSGQLDKALGPLDQAADLQPEAAAPIEELCRTYEALEQWEALIEVKRRRLDVVDGEERSTILLEIGEVLAAKVKDPTRAAKNLIAALEERPDDRRILTRLMKLYSEEKDWSKLVEVVLKLADGVDDDKQRAKYVHTAAVVSARQIGDLEAAAKHFDEVLALDPENTRALNESIDVREQAHDHQGMVERLQLRLDRADAEGDKETIVRCLDRIAKAYREHLERADEAVQLLERAHQLDPDNAERKALLNTTYASDVSKYLDKAVASQLATIRQSPYDAEGYRALRKLFTDAQEADAAWCVCQALHSLSSAEPDEQRFFLRMRSETAAEAQSRLTEDDWDKVLLHPMVDPTLTAIFTQIQPAILNKTAQPIEALGYLPAHALDLSMHPYPMSQTLYYAGGVLGMDLPPTYQNTQDPGGISFLHARPPSVVLGNAALVAELPTQAAAFIAARHLTYYRNGLYVRHLVPTGTGLRAWLFAAIRTIHPTFPVAAKVEPLVAELVLALQPLLQGPGKDQLSSQVSKLLQSGSIDLKRWVAGVDLTADRAGFLVCHDLEVATEMVKASDEAASGIAHRDRMRELTLFAVSPPYFGLRKRLGINIDA